MYVCMYVYTHTHIYIYICVCVCMFIYMNIHSIHTYFKMLCTSTPWLPSVLRKSCQFDKPIYTANGARDSASIFCCT